MSELSPSGGSEGYEVTAILERVMGIEPTRPAWKAGILPLNYTRMGGVFSHISFSILSYFFPAVNGFFKKIRRGKF